MLSNLKQLELIVLISHLVFQRKVFNGTKTWQVLLNEPDKEQKFGQFGKDWSAVLFARHIVRMSFGALSLR